LIRTLRAKVIATLCLLVGIVFLTLSVSYWGTYTMSGYDDQTAIDYNELHQLLSMSLNASLYIKEVGEVDPKSNNNTEESTSAKLAWKTNLDALIEAQRDPESDEVEREQNEAKDLERLALFYQQITKTGDEIVSLTFSDLQKAKGEFSQLNEEIFDNQLLPLLGKMLEKESDEVQARQEADEALGVFLLRFVLATLLVTIVGSSLSAFLILSSITKPIQKLVEGTSALSLGELSYRISSPGSDELSILSHHFDQMAEQLQKAMQREAAAKAKEETYRLQGEFLSTVSHELRTPLNAIMGFAELVSDEALSAQQRSNLHQISSSSQRLLSLINDILDFSKLKAGRMTVSAEPFYLPGLLHDTQQEAKVLARGRDLDIILRVGEGVAEINSDEVKLRQIFSNLASNAVKFTEAGTITITAAWLPNHLLRFSVQDTGIGIPQAQQALVFEPFRQAEHAQAKGQGGSGLGLAIVSQLVELLHGEISLQSQPQRGSTFTVLLPVQSGRLGA
jgi:signal transduction histidine kinase